MSTDVVRLLQIKPRYSIEPRNVCASRHVRQWREKQRYESASVWGREGPEARSASASKKEMSSQSLTKRQGIWSANRKNRLTTTDNNTAVLASVYKLKNADRDTGD